ncbi:MAG: cell division protein ZipA [Halothiobacillus sp.]
MEWLRWVLLVVGVVVLAGIAWAYFRHKSEQAIELGSGRTQANVDDPIDAQIRSQDFDEPLPARQPDELTEPFDAPFDVLVGRRAEPQIHPTEKPLIDPFAVEAEPLRWQQPNFTRSSATPPGSFGGHEDEHEHDVLRSDADGVIGAVRRKELEHSVDPASEHKGGLFRQRQAPRFNYQEKQSMASSGWPPHEAEPVADAPHSHHEPERKSAHESGAAPQPVVIPLLVASLTGAPFPGDLVEDLIEEMGFEFGALSIYHYPGELGEPLFSLMNGVQPGTFDRGNNVSFATPVLALFMQLPLNGQSEILVLDRMIDVARDIADQLGGEVLDDARQPLSSESIDRYREQLNS